MKNMSDMKEHEVKQPASKEQKIPKIVPEAMEGPPGEGSHNHPEGKTMMSHRAGVPGEGKVMPHEKFQDKMNKSLGC